MSFFPGFDWLTHWDMGRNPTAQYKDPDVQSYLPPSLWWNYRPGPGQKKQLTPFALGLWEGQKNLSDLMRNPGSLPANISQSIAPRLAMESENINRSTIGQQANAAGQMARAGTAGSGFASALQASIEQAGQRQQADARREATIDSAKLARSDLDNLFKLYDVLLGFTTQARKANRDQRDSRQDQYNKYLSGFMNLFSSLGSGLASGSK